MFLEIAAYFKATLLLEFLKDCRALLLLRNKDHHVSMRDPTTRD